MKRCGTQNSNHFTFKATALLLSLLIPLMSASQQNPQTATSWEAVKRLKPEKLIVVTLNSGSTVEGRFVSATDSVLTMNAEVGSGILSPREIERLEVRRIATKVDHAGKKRALLIGTAAGTLLGIAAGAAYDSAHPSKEDPGQGKLVFGVAGFFVGPAVALIVQRLHGEHVIYRAP